MRQHRRIAATVVVAGLGLAHLLVRARQRVPTPLRRHLILDLLPLLQLSLLFINLLLCSLAAARQ